MARHPSPLPALSWLPSRPSQHTNLLPLTIPIPRPLPLTSTSCLSPWPLHHQHQHQCCSNSQGGCKGVGPWCMGPLHPLHLESPTYATHLH